jgi:glucose dehydrogenase
LKGILGFAFKVSQHVPCGGGGEQGTEETRQTLVRVAGICVENRSRKLCNTEHSSVTVFCCKYSNVVSGVFPCHEASQWHYERLAVCVCRTAEKGNEISTRVMAQKMRWTELVPTKYDLFRYKVIWYDIPGQRAYSWNTVFPFVSFLFPAHQQAVAAYD